MTVSENFKAMDYGPSLENDDNVRDWLLANDATFGQFINGEWVLDDKNTRIKTHSPATGELLGSITQANRQEIDLAVKSATAAQKKWWALGGHGRAKYLYALARLLQKHSRFLAVLESLDNGKPIRESKGGDVPLAARHFYYHAGWAQAIEQDFPGYEPVGVVGQVIPWNFPLLMLSWKIAPALAAGNCVVIKPAEYTSLTAIKFAELCEEAGLPKGVVNIVTGDGTVGEMIVNHEGFQKLAFTGSTGVGRHIRKAAAGTGKKLTLELGGKSPYIVFEDADLDSAVEGLVDAIWLNQGQVCCAGSRLLVQEGIAEKFLAKVRARMDKLRVGHSLDKGIDIGAIVDPIQLERITAMVEQGRAEGATIYQSDCEMPSDGVYYKPTLVTDVGTDNVLMREEVFGPVLSVLTFRTQAEAVQLANNTRYGLAATVWSESLGRALEVAPALKAGVVWINISNMFDAACGFGGYRESGFGREGGSEGMYEYMKPVFEKALKEAKDIVTYDSVKLPDNSGTTAGIDRTAKMYVGGKQKRPDGEHSTTIADHKGNYAGLVGEGNYKDIRNAVEAASKAQPSWAKSPAHLRSQILYYIAENLSYRADEFATKLETLTGATKKAAKTEVEQSIERLFYYAGKADKFEGRVHNPPMRGVTLAMNEAIGTIGVACPDEAPLLAFVTLMAAAITMGNSTVIIPSQRYPLCATDFYQILETSDVPAGVVNIITGQRDELAPVMAKHLDVDAVWYFGNAEGSKTIEFEAAENMKRTWVSHGKAWNWSNKAELEGDHILRKSVEVKNIWVPYGDAN